MSPSYFTSNGIHAAVLNVTSRGELYTWSGTASGYGVRPVINLKPDTEITSGNGTASSPYIIKYN